MPNDKLRRQIAWEAARLMYQRQESEYYRAKLKAARRIGRGWVPEADLPSNAEIRDQIQLFARMYEGEARTRNLVDMRLAALRLMRILSSFRPKLIGSTLTGHVRQGSDIDIHVFCDSIGAVAGSLDEEGIVHDIERKEIRKGGEQRVFTHIHVQGAFPMEITVYAASMANYPFRSSITGKRIESATIAELEALLRQKYPGVDLDQRTLEAESRVDRFQIYLDLLLPLGQVRQKPEYHPEGDALYHSLQVFDLACVEYPYDEEFLLAALLHDVGKALDSREHVPAALQALDGLITERTAWLIEHHMEGHKLLDGTLGNKVRQRLQESPDFPDLKALAEFDRRGRRPGVPASEPEEAIEYLRELARTCGG